MFRACSHFLWCLLYTGGPWRRFNYSSAQEVISQQVLCVNSIKRCGSGRLEASMKNPLAKKLWTQEACKNLFKCEWLVKLQVISARGHVPPSYKHTQGDQRASFLLNVLSWEVAVSLQHALAQWGACWTSKGSQVGIDYWTCYPHSRQNHLG